MPVDGAAGQYRLADLCTTEFQSEEVKAPSVSEFSGGFGRTKYIMMMVGGLVHSLVNSREKRADEGKGQGEKGRATEAEGRK